MCHSSISKCRKHRTLELNKNESKAYLCLSLLDVDELNGHKRRREIERFSNSIAFLCWHCSLMSNNVSFSPQLLSHAHFVEITDYSYENMTARCDWYSSDLPEAESFRKIRATRKQQCRDAYDDMNEEEE